MSATLKTLVSVGTYRTICAGKDASGFYRLWVTDGTSAGDYGADRPHRPQQRAYRSAGGSRNAEHVRRR
jgi:hypothetical protein